jgi:hypothetical protein
VAELSLPMTGECAPWARVLAQRSVRAVRVVVGDVLLRDCRAAWSGDQEVVDAFAARGADPRGTARSSYACGMNAAARPWQAPSRASPLYAPEDGIRLRHLREAAGKAFEYSSTKTRADLDDDELLRLAITVYLRASVSPSAARESRCPPPAQRQHR